MNNGLTPPYLSNLIPDQPHHRYRLRNDADIPLINTRTTLYQASFLPSTIREWNLLPLNVRASPTLHSFKSQLNAKLRKPPSYYSTGDRQGQILLTRIRLGCSSLNFDLFRKSIVPSSSCACGEIETANHYILSCPLYNAIRQRYLSSLPCPPILNNLVYGCENLDDKENSLIFRKVQQFIIASKRFNA